MMENNENGVNPGVSDKRRVAWLLAEINKALLQRGLSVEHGLTGVTPISSPRVEKLGLQYDRSNPIVRQLSAL